LGGCKKPEMIMKVSELIGLLQQQDPDKEVMIQQGEEYDYMAVYSVRVVEVTNLDDEDNTEAVCIEYS
jgi:hypothetical protein